MKNILVSGAAGFIGSHTTRYLLKMGYNVFGIDSLDPFYDHLIKRKNIEMLSSYNNFNFVQIDILSPDFELIFVNNKIEGIIHLAAKAGVRPSMVMPEEYVISNVQASVKIMELAKKYKIKHTVIASSSSVYGNGIAPSNENYDVSKPISIYAASKVSMENFAHVYAYQFNMNITLLRFFTVYGPGQRPEMAIAKFVRMVSNEEEITIYGDGSNTRDYTYILDIVNGIVKSLAHPNKLQIINIGGGNPVDLNTLIKIISDALGKTPKIRYQTIPKGDVNHTYADIEKAKHILDYHPEYTIKKGIIEYIKWYKSYNKFE